MASTTKSDSALLAELNDLLQLDRDAVQAYTLAEQALESEAHRSTIRRFKGDHERHIEELTGLITARGGTPLDLPHLSSSPFKLAAQGLGDLGSDTTVLLAFKSNERLSRDKYQRAANKGYPADVQAVLQRGAGDESKHYAWVQDTLEQLGAGERTAAGKAERVFETGHARLAGTMEAGEKRLMQGTEAVREKLATAFSGVSEKVGDVSGQLGAGGLRNVWIALGIGLVASQLVGRSSGTPAARPSSPDKSPTPRPTTSARQRPWSERPGVESRDVGLPAL